MKMLAIDSSGLVASVALVTEDKLLGEYTTNLKKTHSQTLLPMLDALFNMLGMEPDQVDAIAVAGGPGSFTGLRIGSATAKGLGLALDKPIVSVPTVDALAYNFSGTSSLVCPLMDARRNQTYTGLYSFEGERMETVLPQRAVAIEEIIEEINVLGRDVIFLGDGVPVFREIIKGSIKVGYYFAPPHLSAQRAGALGALAIKYYEEGRVQSADEHSPDYLRLSQAERERAERLKGAES